MDFGHCQVVTLLTVVWKYVSHFPGSELLLASDCLLEDECCTLPKRENLSIFTGIKSSSYYSSLYRRCGVFSRYMLDLCNISAVQLLP